MTRHGWRASGAAWLFVLLFLAGWANAEKAETVPVDAPPSTGSGAESAAGAGAAAGEEGQAPGESDAGGDSSAPQTDFSEWRARNAARHLPRAFPEPDFLDSKALAEEARLLREVWLDSVAEEATFLLLERKERTGTPQGAALLIPAVDQHGDWPNVLRPLSQRLTEVGWFCFSLSMPYELNAPLPERKLPAKQFDQIVLKSPAEPAQDETASAGPAPDTAESPTPSDPSASETTTESTADTPAAAVTPEAANAAASNENPQIDLSVQDPQGKPSSPESGEQALPETTEEAPPSKVRVPLREAVASRVDASFEYIKKKGYENIVFVAVGNGADSMLDFIERNKGKLPAKGFAMVWIKPEFSGDVGARLEAALDRFPAPLLDIYDSLTPGERERAAERRLIARGQGAARYQLAQMPLSGPPVDKKRRMLPNRVAAWLLKNAPGTKARKLSR